MYTSEEEFLKNYNKFDYDLISLTTDIIIFSVSNQEQTNYRKNEGKKMSVLLVKRDNFPYKDKWCLPGGFLKIDEDIEDAPKRILKDETNLDNIYLEQLYTFGDVSRDPRMRVVSTAYMALINKDLITDKLNKNAKWFDITLYEEKGDTVDIVLDSKDEVISFSIKKTLKDHTTDRYAFKIDKNKDIAFDHAKVIISGLERLRNKCEYTDIVFNMMPEYFTLGELQQVYEVILNKKLLDPAFRRIIAPKVVKTEKQKTGEGHRPSVFFKYKGRN